MPDDDNKPYRVGFGKPPKPSQFRKGLSGNPKGRPKGSRNLVTVLERTLKEKVVINENAVKQLVNQAASGDLAAMRQLSALAGSAEDEQLARPERQLDQDDQEVMENVLKRLKKYATGEENENQ